MNQTVKTVLIVVGAVVLAVALLLTAVFVLSEKLFDMWEDAGLRLPRFTSYSVTGDDSYREWQNAYSADGSYAVDAAGLTGLELDWVAGTVDITVYDGAEVRFTESAKAALTEDNALRYGVSGKKLYIQACKSGTYRDLPGKRLEIMLPRRLAEQMDAFSFDGASCDVTISGVSVKSFDFDSASGSLTASQMRVHELEINTASGDATLSGTFEQIETDTASGSMELIADACPKVLEMDSMSGSFLLTLPETSSFTLHFDALSGRFDCALPLTKKGDAFVAGDGSADFTFDTASGDLCILVP